MEVDSATGVTSMALRAKASSSRLRMDSGGAGRMSGWPMHSLSSTDDWRASACRGGTMAPICHSLVASARSAGRSDRS